MTRNSLKLALLATSGLAFATAAYAPPAAARTEVSLGVGIGIAPPAPRFERMPPPRRGYVWARGYWRWDRYRHAHVWFPGRWVRARAGYRYHSPRWVRHGDDWRLRRSHWDRD
ncbi:MAG: hypothetical protein EPN74_07950 [Rhodanobacter sp.]|nr:MAG: hypothetical protein EPN74_07950 [Rhodanobacter sp.]